MAKDLYACKGVDLYAIDKIFDVAFVEPKKQVDLLQYGYIVDNHIGKGQGEGGYSPYYNLSVTDVSYILDNMMKLKRIVDTKDASDRIDSLCDLVKKCNEKNAKDKEKKRRIPSFIVSSQPFLEFLTEMKENE